MFLDPPYDSEFTDYGYCKFDKTDHIRLAELFKSTKIRCLMVIGKTPFIESLYQGYIVESGEYEKNYRFKIHSGRVGNEINTKHLVITNYQLDITKDVLVDNFKKCHYLNNQKTLITEEESSFCFLVNKDLSLSQGNSEKIRLGILGAADTGGVGKKIKTDFSQDDPLASEGEIDYQKCFSFSRDYSFGEESYED